MLLQDLAPGQGKDCNFKGSYPEAGIISVEVEYIKVFQSMT